MSDYLDYDSIETIANVAILGERFDYGALETLETPNSANIFLIMLRGIILHLKQVNFSLIQGRNI